MTLEELRKHDLILLECLSGSRAYGLDTPNSDTDIKGVFLLPKEMFFGLTYIPQISNESNDIVFYELGRFMELLSVNNPNILELLNSPESAVLFRHPSLNILKSEQILSKLCKDTFGRFALSQIKKARGLNKKIVNPVSEERKSLLSFCYVTYGEGSILLERFLETNKWEQEDCGLTAIPHMKNVFGLYHGKHKGYKGILQNAQSNMLTLSSVPKGEKQLGLLYCNLEGYSSYCKEYREYWEWVQKRNEDRFANTISHGKNYDAKNMMHVFRLLDMAIEIGRDHVVNVKRPNREFLLKIKNRDYEYEELVKLAEDKKREMEAVFEKSSLPETPDLALINQLTVKLREQFYN